MAKGIARGGWDLDIVHGNLREGAFGRLLKEGGVEVKSDGKCRLTGNVFIEFRQHGRPSGIAEDKGSQYWAIEYDDDHWIVIPTERLKQIARVAYRNGYRKRGGDYDGFEGVCFPLKFLFPCPVNMEKKMTLTNLQIIQLCEKTTVDAKSGNPTLVLLAEALAELLRWRESAQSEAEIQLRYQKYIRASRSTRGRKPESR